MDQAFIEANGVKMPRPADHICECCGKMKYAYWNPTLGWYWVHF